MRRVGVALVAGMAVVALSIILFAEYLSGAFATRSPCLGDAGYSFREHPRVFRSALARSFFLVSARYPLVSDEARFARLARGCQYADPKHLFASMLASVRAEIDGSTRTQILAWAAANQFAESGGVGRPNLPGGSSDFELKSPAYCGGVFYPRAAPMRLLSYLANRTCTLRWYIGLRCSGQSCEPVYVRNA